MLDDIRSRVTGWVAWFIVAIIVIPMGFWGVQDYLGTDPNPVVVTIGEAKIKQNQFRSQLQQTQDSQRGQVADELLASDYFKQQVLQRMIRAKVAEQIASNNAYQASAPEIREVIKTIPNFQNNDGAFDQNLYEAFLIGRSSSAGEFEKVVADDVLTAQVTSGYTDSAIILPEDVRFLLKKQLEQREFKLATIDAQGLLLTQVVTDEEIEAYYQQNLQNFQQEEKMSVEYIELNLEGQTQYVNVSDEEVRAIYDAALADGSSDYMSEETRQVRHILLEKNDELSEEAQEQKAKDIALRLRQGASFAKLASTLSQDPGSANQGGDLGVINKGQMVEAFENAAFSLAKDEISAPIKTEFGYHIIKVEKINSARIKPFDEVRDAIKLAEKSQLAESILLEKVEQMRSLAYEQVDDLEGVAQELSLPLQKSTLFSKDQGEGIAQEKLIRDAAFGDEVRLEALNSEPIALENERYVVVRKASVVDATIKPLVDVKTQVTETLQQQKAQEFATTLGSKLLDKSKKDWDVLTQTLQQKSSEYASVKLSEHTFRLAEGEPAHPVQLVRALLATQTNGDIQGLSAEDGNYYLFQVTNIVPADMTKVSDSMKQQVRQLIAFRNGRAIEQSYFSFMYKKLVGEINIDTL